MEKQRLQKKTDKHILSVKKCIHKDYLKNASIMEARRIHCRSCESKWASYERWYIRYILSKININFVHIPSILNYIVRTNNTSNVPGSKDFGSAYIIM